MKNIVLNNHLKLNTNVSRLRVVRGEKILVFEGCVDVRQLCMVRNSST